MSRTSWDRATGVLLVIVGAQAVNWLTGDARADSGTFRHTAVALQAALGFGGALWLWRPARIRER